MVVNKNIKSEEQPSDWSTRVTLYGSHQSSGSTGATTTSRIHDNTWQVLRLGSSVRASSRAHNDRTSLMTHDLTKIFRSIATSYLFITTHNDLLSASIPTLQSLSASLGFPFTLEELLECSKIAPELMEIRDGGALRLLMPKKRKRNQVEVLVTQFTALLERSGTHGPSEVLEEPKAPKSIQEVIEFLGNGQDRIAGLLHVSPKSPSYATLIPHLHPKLLEILESQDRKLYTHQASALESMQSTNIVVTTSTASGKSLIYTLYLLDALLRDPDTKAILIFPTKALAQDQATRLRQWVEECGLCANVDTYDGDTPRDSRRRIRESASILLTNPDTLHKSILPNHSLWAPFLGHLQLVMIDEVHYYHSELGAHVFYLFLRLRRICVHYGSSPRYMGCSATLDDKIPFFPHQVIDNDGAPCGEKHYAIVRKRETRTLVDEACDLIRILVRAGIRTIVFAKTRRDCELVSRTLHDEKVMSYRGGYLPSYRRQVEKKLREGEIRCVVATNALELGMDIGSLDAVVHVGFPPSFAAFVQQSGRVGRRGTTSLDISVLDPENPREAYFADHPETLLDPHPRPFLVDLEDESIIGLHIRSAAYELAVSEEDILLEEWEEAVHTHLTFDGAKKRFITLEDHPASKNGIRTIEESHFQVIGPEGLLEEVPTSRVPFTLYQSHPC
jgi:ATP-dependent helicase YprA (DUF1998 family)